MGDATLVWRAAHRLGVQRSALAPAEDAQLVEVGTRVRFRHPLIRSAVYRAAVLSERRAAHRALAEATDPETDPDRRAWHRAHAAVGDDETFEIPVPRPPFPQHDVVFFRGPGPEGPADREHEDILLRRVPRDTAARFRAGAGGRSLTHAQYLAALVELHRRLREAADGGDEQIAKELEALGLSSVSV